MARDLDPRRVAKRLAALAALYVPEAVEQARERLRDESRSPATFAMLVGRRLDELRASTS